MLRSFFLLIFLTFVFAFIQARVVEGTEVYIKSRTLRCWLVGILVLIVLSLVAVLTIPSFKSQTEKFALKLPDYMQLLDKELRSFAKEYPTIAAVLPEEGFDKPAPLVWEPATSPTIKLAQQVFGADLTKTDNSESAKSTVLALKSFGTQVVNVVSSFFLALLLSFLIVLDLPKLAASIKNLEQTKIRFIYREVSPTIRDFCVTLGKSLEAQLGIALINSVLTTIGLMILGLSQKLVFLSIIVFICGFIPILGVFISSLPICLVALQESGGFWLVFLCILMIVGVHMVEAYILNPKIYGQRLHMNPVLVLIILTIAGKLFHVWGLLLGLPLCTYIFGHAIRYRHLKE